MDKKRFFLSLLVITGFILVLTTRLFWIQIIDTSSFSALRVNLVKNSVAQREFSIILDSGRGQFLDRHYENLTGNKILSLLVTPVDESGKYSFQAERLASILNIKMSEWNEFTANLNVPKLFFREDHSHRSAQSVQPNQSSLLARSNRSAPIELTPKQVQDINLLGYPGIKVVPYVKRYPDFYAASHLLGYIGENPQRIRELYKSKLDEGKLSISDQIGGAGLEKTFDSLLHSVGRTKVSFFNDANSEPFSGISIREVSPSNPFYPLKVITTLEKTIQLKLEELVDSLGIKEGSIVVLDTSNADVVAMVSRPKFDPYRVELNQGNWSNKALKAITPGSVFKTVVAAAALEEKKVHPKEMFECKGHLGKYGLSCWKKGGHGHLSFEEAYANSCNVVFAKIMERLSSEQLAAYAQKLGLARQVGWSTNDKAKVGDAEVADKGEGDAGEGAGYFSQFDQEEGGQIFAKGSDTRDGGLLAQTAIGQRDVLMTPLQAANLAVTLLNNGEVKAPRVVKEVVYQNNRPKVKFKEHVIVGRKNGISGRTSRILRQGMEEVVRTGTGQKLQKAKWNLAGKSGTAEVTVQDKPREHQWFTGYGPVESPKYVVSVAVQNASPGGGNKATGVFSDVMDILSGY